MAKSKDTLVLGAILALGAASLVFLVSKVPMSTELMQVAMMIVGMLTIAVLSAISRYIQANGDAPFIRITFNEGHTRRGIDDIISVAYKKETEYKFTPKIQSWEPTSDSLKDEDPVLALAKLRIDIERELRRIAYEYDIATEPRKVSIRYLLDALARRDALQYRIVAAIHDVLPVCNMAIHGGEVTPEVASAVLNIGEDLLRVLRVTRKSLYSESGIPGGGT